MLEFKLEPINVWYGNGTPCFCFYREPVTDVIYVEKRTSGGMTVMMNPETGKPLTYTDYVKIKEKQSNGTT